MIHSIFVKFGIYDKVISTGAFTNYHFHGIITINAKE